MKEFIKTTKIIILALVVMLGANYVYAWVGPTDTPPDGNTPAPINTSATAQYKTGALSVGGALRGYASAIFDGDLKIETGNLYFRGDTDQRLYGNGNGTMFYYSGHDTIASMQFRDGTDDRHGYIYGSGNGNYFGLLDGDGNWGYLGAKDSYTQFRIDNNPKMTIRNAGGVGIGDTTPDNGLLLDVEGGVGATEYCDENGENCVAAADLGGGGGEVRGWTSLDLNSSDDFNMNCEYKFEANGNWNRANVITETMIQRIFNGMDANTTMGYYSINSTSKTVRSFHQDNWSNNMIYGNDTVTQILESCGGGSGGGENGPVAISSQFTAGAFSFSKPAGATKAHVKIHGGGAAGRNYTGGNYGGSGGASGAYAEKIIDVSSITSLSGSVGSGGSPSGGSGGNTILTGHMTANGGVGTTAGTATGGDLNFNGENGYGASGGYMGGPGGNGYHGGSGSARGPHVQGMSGRKGGGGAGGSGYSGAKIGGSGGIGFVTIYWY